MEQKLNSNSSAGAAADSDLQPIVIPSADIAVNPMLPACGSQADDEENEWDVYDECLNCGSSWGIGSEEHDFQQCDACGWMPGEPTDDDMPDDNDDELDYEPVS